MPRFQLGRAKNSSQCRRVRPKRTSIRPKLTSCTSSDKSFSPAACRSRLRTRGGLPEEALVVWRRKSGNGAPAGVVVHAAAGRHVGWHRPGSRGNRPKPRNFPCPESVPRRTLVGRAMMPRVYVRAPWSRHVRPANLYGASQPAGQAACPVARLCQQRQWPTGRCGWIHGLERDVAGDARRATATRVAALTGSGRPAAQGAGAGPPPRHGTARLRWDWEPTRARPRDGSA